MRLPLTLKVKCGQGVAEKALRHLEGRAQEKGWRRSHHPTPGTLAWKAPPGRLLPEVQVAVWRNPTTDDVLVFGVDVRGHPLGTASQAHDEPVLAFFEGVIRPVAEAVGAEVDFVSALAIHDLVPERVALALEEFVEAEERDCLDGFHPQDSKRFPPVVLLVHTSGADLDGATLAHWLREDRGWPKEVARSLGRRLDEGLAFLLTYPPAQEDQP